MHAAVVTTFDAPPAYREFPDPTPQAPDEMVVDVIASGLHPRVRSQANGSHYTSSGELPLVPGIDGVGRAPDGTMRYFVLADTTLGAMAEQTVIDQRRSIALPDGADPILVAASMNPLMSSWIALRRRINFEQGQTVLILGATGSSGRMAVQVAKRLGASHVIGAGRDAQRLSTLADLGADATARLDNASAVSDLAEAARDVDVVIDYLWGPITADVMVEIAGRRSNPGKPLTWKSAQSPGPRPRSPPRRCAPCVCRLWEAGRGRSRPATSWPKFPRWRTRSPRALFMLMPERYRLPTSKRLGTTRPPTSASSSRPRLLPAVPVALVARVAVKPVIIVTAAPVPVAAPARVPPLTWAPVIAREGRGVCLGDGGRPQTCQTQAGAHNYC